VADVDDARLGAPDRHPPVERAGERGDGRIRWSFLRARGGCRYDDTREDHRRRRGGQEQAPAWAGRTPADSGTRAHANLLPELKYPRPSERGTSVIRPGTGPSKIRSDGGAGP